MRPPAPGNLLHVLGGSHWVKAPTTHWAKPTLVAPAAMLGPSGQPWRRLQGPLGVVGTRRSRWLSGPGVAGRQGPPGCPSRRGPVRPLGPLPRSSGLGVRLGSLPELHRPLGPQRSPTGGSSRRRTPASQRGVQHVVGRVGAAWRLIPWSRCWRSPTAGGAGPSASSDHIGPPRSRLLRALGATVFAPAGARTEVTQPQGLPRLASPLPAGSAQGDEVTDGGRASAVPGGQVPQGTGVGGLAAVGPPGPATGRPPSGGVRAQAVAAIGGSSRSMASGVADAGPVALQGGQIPQGTGDWGLGAAGPLGSVTDEVPPLGGGAQGPAAAGSNGRGMASTAPS